MNAAGVFVAPSGESCRGFLRTVSCVVRCAAAGQPECAGLPGAGRWDAPVRADHDQRQGSAPDEEPLDAAVLDHEPEEPRLPRDRGQHEQRGLQHELHEFVGQQGEDGDGRGRRGRAPAAVRLRGGQAVQAPGHERGPEAGLRLRRNEEHALQSLNVGRSKNQLFAFTETISKFAERGIAVSRL